MRLFGPKKIYWELKKVVLSIHILFSHINNWGNHRKKDKNFFVELKSKKLKN